MKRSVNMPNELNILSTISEGYGPVEKSEWETALSWNPDVIVAQGTSTDPGPTYLGTAQQYNADINLKRDLEQIILAAEKRHIPFILSLGCPAGTNRQLKRSLWLVSQICEEANIKLRVAVIPGEINKAYLKQKLKSGANIRRLVETNALSEYLSVKDINRSRRIVAQMGPEPIMKALELEIDGVITGRALDTGLYMALPLKMGFDKGLAAHMAKVIECGALAAEGPGEGLGAIFAILKNDHFLVRPPSRFKKCTVKSVVSHSFYERPDPTREENPGGILDTGDAKFEQYDEKTVKVSESRWIPTQYTLKLEGAELTGYRTISICGIRDPQLIRYLDVLLDGVRRVTEEKFLPLKQSKDYKLIFRSYGKDGVLGEAEPKKETKAHEVGVIIDVVAKTQELASGICATARIQAAFQDFPGRKTTAGNMAWCFSPNDAVLGPVYRYNIWHALELDDPCEPFNIKIYEFPTEVQLNENV
jgi:hypothetical protein